MIARPTCGTVHRRSYRRHSAIRATCSRYIGRFHSGGFGRGHSDRSVLSGIDAHSGDRCITDEEVGLVLCPTGTEERIEVHTPSGRVIVQGRVQSSSTTTYGGETTTAENAYRSVSVFEWYVDGLIFDAQTIKLKVRARWVTRMGWSAFSKRTSSRSMTSPNSITVP
jgi:hypothetical protein